MVDISNLTSQEISDLLTKRGIEVEGIEEHPVYVDNIVAAELKHIEEHPNSDHLHIVQVNYGAEETIQVVCGAPGIQEGWIVPFAQIGTKFGDFEIKKAKLRGVQSFGMLCSEREIGVSDDHETLMRLPEGTRPGTPLAQVLRGGVPEDQVAFHETIFDISLTPDRGDCLSVKGIARELSAALHKELVLPKLAELPSTNADNIVTIENGEDCAHYCAIVLEGIRVTDSPAWLRRAVEACGARSVNNVVDVTNYVCFELGHPLHAFDLNKLAGKHVRVRRARNGEKLEAINHEKYDLGEKDLVIADDNGPVAIAGVMGGAPTEVSKETTAILLEAASFDPTLVRKTSKKLGLHSESSHRFERFVDPNGVLSAARRALWLLREAQAEEIHAVAFQDNVARPLEPLHIELRIQRVNDVLGTHLGKDEIIAFLEPIGLHCETLREGVLDTLVPTYRADITREIDIIEEICRGYGFDNIEARLPLVQMRATHRVRKENLNPTPYPVSQTIWPRKERLREHTLRQCLIDSGINECMHYTFMEPEDPGRLRFPEDAPESKPMRVANPLAIEQSCMRTTLIPSMLRALKVNLSRQQKSVTSFELGSVFFPKAYDSFTALEEKQHLVILMWGESAKRWNAAPRPYDIFDVKGLLESIAAEMRWHFEFAKNADTVPWLHPGVQAAVSVDGKTVGFFGELHPGVAEAFKVENPVFIADLDMTALNAVPSAGIHFEALPKFPASSRDLALVISSDITFDAISKAVEENRPEILESWELFDIYKGKQIVDGLQSVAMTFVYRDPKARDAKEGRTLTDEEIQTAHAQLTTALQKALGAQMRE